MFAVRAEPTLSVEIGPELRFRLGKALDFARSASALLLQSELPIDLKTYEASPDKLVAETALLVDSVLLLKGRLDGRLVQNAETLAHALLPHARSRQLAIACLSHPGLSKDYFAAHLVLGRCGFPDPSFDRLLDVSTASGLANCRERLPHRKLEQAWLDYLGGVPFEREKLVAETALAYPQDVLFSSRDDVYAFTHALMYVTDFGRLALLDTLLPEVLCEIADAALVSAMDCDDFDLAGELLLTWPLINRPFSDRAVFCFQVLCHIDDEVGILPSFSLDGREYRELADHAREHYKAATSYHTVYVLGLLCSLLLLRNWEPEFFPVNRSGTKDHDSNPDAKQPEWSRIFDLLDEPSQSALDAFRADVDLLRLVRKMDLEGLRGTLRDSAHDGSASLIQLQCARLLKRLSANELNVIFNR